MEKEAEIAPVVVRKDGSIVGMVIDKNGNVVGMGLIEDGKVVEKIENMPDGVIEQFAMEVDAKYIPAIEKYNHELAALIVLVKLVVDPLALVFAAKDNPEAETTIADLINEVLNDIPNLEPAPAPESIALAAAHAASNELYDVASELTAILDIYSLK